MKTLKSSSLFLLALPFIFLLSCKEDLKYELNTPQFTKGWYIKEPSGLQWSEGKTSSIVLYENKLNNKKRKLIVKGLYFKKEQPSKLFLNNNFLGDIKFDKNKEAQFEIALSDNYLPDSLTFEHFNVQSPFDHGGSNDKRQLKLSINSVVLQ